MPGDMEAGTGKEGFLLGALEEHGHAHSLIMDF